MKIVYVEWLDASSVRGWNGLSENNGLVKIRSVGFLVEKTKTFIAISTSHSVWNKCVDPLSIPRKLILKYRVLKTVED
jgi:hypothetical protein